MSDQDAPVLALAAEEEDRPECFDPADLLDRLERLSRPAGRRCMG